VQISNFFAFPFRVVPFTLPGACADSLWGLSLVMVSGCCGDFQQQPSDSNKKAKILGKSERYLLLNLRGLKGEARVVGLQESRRERGSRRVRLTQQAGNPLRGLWRVGRFAVWLKQRGVFFAPEPPVPIAFQARERSEGGVRLSSCKCWYAWERQGLRDWEQPV
jgi:hypothetical protein